MPGGMLLLLDGYRDNPLGWFIYDLCVATVEGDVKHASARRFRGLFEQANLVHVRQHVHYGPAPFLVNIGYVPPLPKPHVHVSMPIRQRVASV